MASGIPLVEKDQIEVGKPLPFSVYSADGQLLLAAGRQVESDRARLMLLQAGVYRGPSSIDRRAGDDPNESYKPSPLTALYKDYGASHVAKRFAITMAPNETAEAFSSWVLGATEQSLIVTAPARADGQLVAVTAGQTWLCRTFQVTSAFRFRAAVLKTVFEPFPHLHLEAPKQVEHRKIRGQPRANLFVNAMLDGVPPILCVLLDLSVTGGRVALEKHLRFERGQRLRLHLRIDLVDYHFDLALKCAVVSVLGPTDSRHPDVAFYGVQFEDLSELETLILHGFVNEHLAMELNCLWQLLSQASAATHN